MLVKSTVHKEVGMSAGSYDTWNYTKRFRMKRQFVFPRGRSKQDDLTLAFTSFSPMKP